ncbi:hypothetical protein QF022_001706 [Vogesella perlucida]|nr:hypothetical protein [Vogesella perlucida]
MTQEFERNPLLIALDLAHRARQVTEIQELFFLLVNDSKRLLPYRQAVLWREDKGVVCVSGVSQFDANSPYMLWLAKLCRQLFAQQTLPRVVQAADVAALDPELAAEWSQWLGGPLACFVLPADGDVPGLLYLVQMEPEQPTASVPLLEEWFSTWAYCYKSVATPRLHLRHVLRRRWQHWHSLGAELPWWKRRHFVIAMALTALLLFPVQLTVLAPAEVVPARPVMVRAPLEGVIKQFFVQPNARVKAGQPLYAYDDEALRAKLDVASQAFQAAESEYRQYAQLALNDQKSKNQIAALQAKLNEKQIELDYLQGQLARATVLASADGVAVIDEPTEWIGKPVQVGERVMKLARPDELEVEAWLSLSDRLDFDHDAAVRFYRAAQPFAPLDARLRYIAYEAQPRPEGHFAYRARAALRQPPDTAVQIGQRGTAKLYAGWTPMIYWILRKPIATVRQYLAI